MRSGVLAVTGTFFPTSGLVGLWTSERRKRLVAAQAGTLRRGPRQAVRVALAGEAKVVLEAEGVRQVRRTRAGVAALAPMAGVGWLL